MKRILIFSLTVNVALLVMTSWRKSHQVTLPVREIRGEPQTAQSEFHRRHARAAVQPTANTPWSRIETQDARQFIANLRAAGCPEATICDIVTLRVCRAHRARVLEIETELLRKQADNPNLDRSEWDKTNELRQGIRDEMMAELESLLGVDWKTLSSSLTGRPVGLDGLNKILSAEKRAAARDVEKQFRKDLEAMTTKRMMEGLDKDEVATARSLERQKRAALAAVLSPQELEEYLYRDSDVADYVRQNLPEAKTEAEYRAMVKLALEMEMSQRLDSNQHNYGMSTEEADAERKQRGKEYAARLKELLGEDRIAEQQAEEKARKEAEDSARKEQDKERFRQEMTTMATEVGVSIESATQFFDRVKDVQPALKKKFEEMEKNLAGTPEEKKKQMEAAIKAELTGLAIETMGDKGPAVIEKMLNRER